jgi:molybdenum cofactor cytidylyltransferase
MAHGCAARAVAPVVIILLAAGASSRMRGRDKLTEDVGGQPLVRHVATEALATGVPVVAVLPPDRPDRVAALTGLALRTVTEPQAVQGMALSLRRGLAEARSLGAAAAMILPADMPDLTTADLALMLAEFRADPTCILRGASGGQPGHPVILPADLWPELEALTGDEGGRSVILRHAARLRMVPLPVRHALTDLDTPGDWAAFRARSGRQQ